MSAEDDASASGETQHVKRRTNVWIDASRAITKMSKALGMQAEAAATLGEAFTAISDNVNQHLASSSTSMPSIRSKVKAHGKLSIPEAVAYHMQHGEGHGKGGRKRKKAPRDENKPKRAKTAYMHFVTENMELIRESNPEIAQKEVMSEIGRQWRALSAGDKAQYEAKAEVSKRQYEEDMEKYNRAKAQEHEEHDEEDEEGEEEDEQTQTRERSESVVSAASVASSAVSQDSGNDEGSRSHKKSSKGSKKKKAKTKGKKGK